MLARVVFAGLVIVLAWLLILFARLVGLRIPRLFPLRIARHERLLLDRDEARFGAEIRKTLAVVVAVL
jgi:Na+-transporting methylmalonyl-CoA/oxaloacetate decarboxylase gamma subunit